MGLGHGFLGELSVDDLLIGVVATDADDLYRVAGLILGVPGVERTTMSVAMHEVVAYRTRPLLEALAKP